MTQPMFELLFPLTSNEYDDDAAPVALTFNVLMGDSFSGHEAVTHSALAEEQPGLPASMNATV